MTQAKKLKRAIRARARKTGERYAAARRQVLESRRQKPTALSAAPVKLTPAPAARPSRGGGLSEAAARKRTGCGVDHWFAVLDAFGAIQKGHTAAARHLNESHRINGWYSQGITVAYERARGLRTVNQRRSGSFEVSVSKVVDAPVEDVADARLRYPTDGKPVEINVIAKPGRRATVVATVMKLASAQAVEAQRAAWRGAFASLKDYLAP